jgi:hypothetical protein
MQTEFSDTSIAVGANGNPVISYFWNQSGSATQMTSGFLSVAACVDPTCSDATVTSLESTGVTGQGSAIAIGPTGYPVIAYYDRTNQDLKLARCSNSSCTAAELSIIDSAGKVGSWENSVAVASDGRIVITYFDETNQALKIAVIPAS